MHAQLLAERVALVTGASRGIGAATARLLARHGAAVAVNYHRQADAAHAVVAAIEGDGGRALLAQADVRDADQVAAMVKRVGAALGPIDVLVLNAGMLVAPAPLLQVSWADMETKLVGELQMAFYPARAVVPAMVARGHGSVVVVSSDVSRAPQPGLGAHAASKAALDAFAKTLALEVGPAGVRVNVVAPRLTMTLGTAAFVPPELTQARAQRTPLRRNGEPEDMAGVIAWLASDLAAFVTGAYVLADGGLHPL